MIISSQRYLNQDIVNEKVEKGDFTVNITPFFTYEGATYQVVTDGHHSLAAAKEAGAQVDYNEIEDCDCDYLDLIYTNPEEFLNISHLGSDYYNTETGLDIW